MNITRAVSTVLKEISIVKVMRVTRHGKLDEGGDSVSFSMFNANPKIGLKLRHKRNMIPISSQTTSRGHHTSSAGLVPA